MFSCYLSISGITLHLQTDRPLLRNREFEPFLTQETVADITAVFCEAAQVPDIPDSVIFADECYRIGKDNRGLLQKFFFEKPDDPLHYAVATYDLAHRQIRIDYLKSYGHCVSEIRNCFYHLGFEAILIERNKLCLHASCVQTSFGGILFSGASGIGKSTQAELWCKYRGAMQINGDRPLLSKDSSGWTAWGAPYAGSSRCHINQSCPISAVVLLKQAKSCTLRRLAPAEAFRGIWPGLTVRSWDPAFVEAASLLAMDLVVTVPVFEFCCTPDEAAVIHLEQELRKEYCHE